MTIKWPNVFALVLILAVLIIILKYGPQLTATLSMLTAIGPGHSTEDQTIGLLVLGLLAVTIVAVTRMLTAKQEPKK